MNTFAAWVERIAAQLAEGRRQIAQLGREIPSDAWSRPSPDEGWTYKDLLAHLAAGDWALQLGLRAITSSQSFDLGSLPDVDEQNEASRRERRDRSVPALIAEVESEGRDTQDLLSQLREEHEELRPSGAPMTLGEYLRTFPGHDQAHIAQLRTALEAS